MSSRSLNSSFVSGTLCYNTALLFEQWKRHLEFQYDFVQVFFANESIELLQGIIRENERIRDEMHRMEKELCHLRMLYTSGQPKIGQGHNKDGEDDVHTAGDKTLSEAGHNPVMVFT